MTHKQRIINSVRREKQTHFPSQIDYTMEMEQKIKRLLKVNDANIDEYLDNHIRYYGFDDKITKDTEKGIQYDIWGVGWDLVLTEGFHFRFHPLEDSEDLTKYNIPTPSEDFLRSLKGVSENNKKEYFILFDQGWTLFERGWMLRGLENFLLDFYYRKKEVIYLLDGIVEFHLQMAEKILNLGIIDGIYTGDDIGTQRGMLISPDMWRKFFKKRYKKLWSKYKEKDIVIFHHSCGNIIEVVPDMIDIGLDVLTPIQPEAMEPALLSKEFGKYLSFMGGISTQTTLPYGTPKDVEKEVISRIKILGKHDGYIISPSHEVTSDCKDENFLKLLEVINNYKKDKI